MSTQFNNISMNTTNNPIDSKFQLLSKDNHKGLICYIMAGDPDLNLLQEQILALEEGGADIIELGIPHSDPLADGPIIQEAGNRSLNNGFNIDKFFSILYKIKDTINIPIVIMVYYNTVYQMGLKNFCEFCAKCNVAGVIIPDLSFEENESIEKSFSDYGVHFIQFVAPTTKNRTEDIVRNSKGFIYCVSSTGITGEKSFHSSLQEFTKNISSITATPRAIGFGISSPNDIREIYDYSEAFIVGSAIIKNMHQSNYDIKKLKNFIKQLKKACL